MSDYKLVPVELIEHVRHARRELTRHEVSPMHVRQRLAQKITDLLVAAPAVHGEPLEALYECIAEARDACLDDDHWMCRDKLMGVLDGIQQLRNKESK